MTKKYLLEFIGKIEKSLSTIFHGRNKINKKEIGEYAIILDKVTQYLSNYDTGVTLPKGSKVVFCTESCKLNRLLSSLRRGDVTRIDYPMFQRAISSITIMRGVVEEKNYGR